MDKIKVGDKVRIIATEWDRRELSATVGFEDEMANCFGKVGIVAELWYKPSHQTDIVNVTGDKYEKIWAWPMKFVEKVDDMSKTTKNAFLTAEKVMERGIPMFRVTGFGNVLTENELPRVYVSGYPRFYLEKMGHRKMADQIKLATKTELGGSVRGHSSGMGDVNYFYTIRTGDLLGPADFGDFIAELKRCGERLALINREIREKEAEWVGPEKKYEI